MALGAQVARTTSICITTIPGIRENNKCVTCSGVLQSYMWYITQFFFISCKKLAIHFTCRSTEKIPKLCLVYMFKCACPGRQVTRHKKISILYQGQLYYTYTWHVSYNIYMYLCVVHSVPRSYRFYCTHVYSFLQHLVKRTFYYFFYNLLVCTN